MVLLRESGMPQPAIAEAMGVSLSTVNRAHMAYDHGGLKQPQVCKRRSKNPSVKQPSWSVWPARAPVFWGRVTALLIRRWRDTWTELARASARDDGRVSSDVSNFRQFLFQTRCRIFAWDGTPARYAVGDRQ